VNGKGDMPEFKLTSSVSQDALIGHSHAPACRLVSLFTASGKSETASKLAVELGRKAASFGETVLILDAADGALMDQAGIMFGNPFARTNARPCGPPRRCLNVRLKRRLKLSC